MQAAKPRSSWSSPAVQSVQDMANVETGCRAEAQTGMDGQPHIEVQAPLSGGQDLAALAACESVETGFCG